MVALSNPNDEFSVFRLSGRFGANLRWHCRASQKTLAAFYNSEVFMGRFKAVERAFFDVPQAKARRAIIEVELMYRALDDAQGLSPSLLEFELGTVFSRAGAAKPLHLREMANKIIHAQNLEWTFEEFDDPKLVCHAYENDDRFDWSRAEIRVRCIAQACAWLAV
jgi:hypothetical protein